MDDFQLWACVWILLTALIWGCTNPLLRKGAQGIGEVRKTENAETQKTGLFGKVKLKLLDILAELKWK